MVSFGILSVSLTFGMLRIPFALLSQGLEARILRILNFSLCQEIKFQK